MDAKIIFEDDYLAAVDKPSGLVVNRSNTHAGITLQEYVEKNVVLDEEVTDDSDFITRSGIVHRLDKDTSGILLVAKTQEVFTKLQHMFKERKIEKEYMAVVFGEITDSYFEVDAPLIRHPKYPFKYAVGDEGRESLTKFEMIRVTNIEGAFYTTLKVMPKTGRTHQIRVHLAALNHPICNDILYCNQSQILLSQKHFTRLMLHAKSLKFDHPYTRDKLLLESPLPAEFLAYI